MVWLLMFVMTILRGFFRIVSSCNRHHANILSVLQKCFPQTIYGGGAKVAEFALACHLRRRSDHERSEPFGRAELGAACYAQPSATGLLGSLRSRLWITLLPNMCFVGIRANHDYNIESLPPFFYVGCHGINHRTIRPGNSRGHFLL